MAFREDHLYGYGCQDPVSKDFTPGKLRPLEAGVTLAVGLCLRFMPTLVRVGKLAPFLGYGGLKF